MLAHRLIQSCLANKLKVNEYSFYDVSFAVFAVCFVWLLIELQKAKIRRKINKTGGYSKKNHFVNLLSSFSTFQVPVKLVGKKCFKSFASFWVLWFLQALTIANHRLQLLVVQVPRNRFARENWFIMNHLTMLIKPNGHRW